MKIHTVSMLLVLCLAAILSIIIGVSFKQSPMLAATEKTAPQNMTRLDLPGTINGAINPTKIPDNVAYLMLFRLIANRQGELNETHIRDYFKQIGIDLGLQTCPACPRRGLDKADGEVILATVNEFHQRASILDKEGEEIKERHHPQHGPLTLTEKGRMLELNRQRESLITESVASLRTRLSATGWAKLQFHIRERVKRNVKIYPS